MIPIRSREEDVLPAGWSVYVDATSGVRYYHESTKHATQWTRPGEVALPAGWFVLVDPASGHRYYFERESLIPQWTRPETNNERPQEIIGREQRAHPQQLEEPCWTGEWDVAAIVDKTMLYAEYNWTMRDFVRTCEKLCHDAHVQSPSYERVCAYLESQGRALSIGPDPAVPGTKVQYIGPVPRGAVVKRAEVLGYRTFGKKNMFHDEICSAIFATVEEYVQHLGSYCTDCKMFGNKHCRTGVVEGKRPCLRMEEKLSFRFDRWRELLAADGHVDL